MEQLESGLRGQRDAFLNRLQDGAEALMAHEAFAAYWREVALRSSTTEDLGALQRWLDELSRDRNALESLRARGGTGKDAESDPMGFVTMIAQLLALLDRIEGTVRKRLHRLRDELGLWVFLVGPGGKSKPAPRSQDAEKAEDKMTPLMQRPAANKPTGKTKGS